MSIKALITRAVERYPSMSIANLYREKISAVGCKIFSAALVTALLFFAAQQPGYAAPPPVAAGNICFTPGATQLNTAQTEILACLYNPNNPNQLLWWRAGTAGVNLNNLPGINCTRSNCALNFDGQNFSCVNVSTGASCP